MRVFRVTYGCGYGRHYDEIELEDDLSDEEIVSQLHDVVMQYFDWGFEEITEQGEDK